MRIKTIGYICSSDPFNDRNAWSGSIFKIREAIEKAGYNVIWIPYKTRSIPVLVGKILRRIEKKICHAKFLGDVFYYPILKGYSTTIDMEIVDQCDYIFIPQCAPLALFLKTEKPIVYLSDATIPLLNNYYWYGLASRSLKNATSLEGRGCQRADIIIMTSQWAHNSVLNDYQCNPEKCYVIEFGPNVEKKDIVPAEPYYSGTLNILFSGVDWNRKGGNIAVEAVRLLRNKGIDAHLFVAGPKECPNEIIDCEFVTYIGFLNKEKPLDYDKYINLYKKSHLFILPTKAECSGIVFCEAAAFGLPCYAYETGGTGNYVIDGYNGRLLPLSVGSKDFANSIYEDLVSKKIPIYHANALAINKKTLSWEVWASKFSNILKKISA